MQPAAHPQISLLLRRRARSSISLAFSHTSRVTWADLPHLPSASVLTSRPVPPCPPGANQMLEVGASEEHVEEYLATRGSLPFTLEEFVESKQAWLKAKREREAAERQELQNRLRAASEEPLDVDVIGGPPLVDSMDRRRAPMPSPKRGPEYESNLAEALGSRPVETGFATPSAGGMRKAPTGGAPRSGPALRGAAKQRANASGGEGAAGGRGKRDDDDDSVWGAE